MLGSTKRQPPKMMEKCPKGHQEDDYWRGLTTLCRLETCLPCDLIRFGQMSESNFTRQAERGYEAVRKVFPGTMAALPEFYRLSPDQRNALIRENGGRGWPGGKPPSKD